MVFHLNQWLLLIIFKRIHCYLLRDYMVKIYFNLEVFNFSSLRDNKLTCVPLMMLIYTLNYYHGFYYDLPKD